MTDIGGADWIREISVLRWRLRTRQEEKEEKEEEEVEKEEEEVEKQEGEREGGRGGV